MSSEKQDRNPTVNAPSNGAAKPGQVTKWSKHVHPDGWIYWYKCELEGDIETAEIRGALEGCIGQLRFGSSGELLPGGVAVKTPCPVTGFGGLRVLMYIDHNRRYASRQRTQVISKTQDYDESELHYNYWVFMRDFPAHKLLPRGSVTAARQALHCYVMEGMRLGPDSQAPFALSESRDLLDYLGRDLTQTSDYAECPGEDPPSSTIQEPLQPSRVALVSWILLNLATHRRKNKYGLKTFDEANRAALPSTPSTWFILLSVICFGAPLDQRKHINAAKRSSDLRGDLETWPAYVEQLVREWSTFNLAATVLLSASVGFLAIPGLDSVSRTAALVSVVFTLGCIMTSVYLLWRHQGGRQRLEYNISLLRPGFHVDFLAIILSMPFVSLAWGVLAFLVAVLLYSFRGFQATLIGANVPIQRKSSYAVLVPSIAIIVILLGSFGFLRMFRERHSWTSAV